MEPPSPPRTYIALVLSRRNYTRAGVRVGLTQEQVKGLFFHLNFYIGQSLSRRALGLAREVFGSSYPA